MAEEEFDVESLRSDGEVAIEMLSRGKKNLPSDLLPDWCRATGLNPIFSELKKIMDDKGKDGEFSIDELMAVHSEFRKSPGTLAEFMEGWKVFDREVSGQMSSGEFRHILGHLGDCPLSDRELDKILDGWVDEDGNIPYEVFTTNVMSG